MAAQFANTAVAVVGVSCWMSPDGFQFDAGAANAAHGATYILYT